MAFYGIMMSRLEEKYVFREAKQRDFNHHQEIPDLLVIGIIDGVDGVYEKIGMLHSFDWFEPREEYQVRTFRLG
jgi:hypothetical protein